MGNLEMEIKAYKKDIEYEIKGILCDISDSEDMLNILAMGGIEYLWIIGTSVDSWRLRRKDKKRNKRGRKIAIEIRKNRIILSELKLHYMELEPNAKTYFWDRIK